MEFMEYRDPIILYLDDKPSTDYGIKVYESNILSAPSKKLEFIEVDGRDGALTVDNGYEDFILKLSCVLANEHDEVECTPALARRAKKFLLDGVNRKIQLSEDMDFYLLGTYNSDVDIEEAIENFGLFQAQFRCKPYRFSNKNKTVEEIKTNAYIENAKISRKIPNKIEINIEEREATYNVEFLNGYAYINNQGYILEKTEQKIEKPVIRGISTEQEQIVEGNRLNDDDLEKLETVIQIMNICKSYELDTKVSSIDVTSKNDYILEMDEEKKTVHLGNDSNLNNKMLYVPAILTENKGKEGTIYLNGDINNNFKPRFREKV